MVSRGPCKTAESAIAVDVNNSNSVRTSCGNFIASSKSSCSVEEDLIGLE